ncbi:hypothetical protein KKF91_00790 [Myxococcota bacterium]|nr:hypothetical protein [Myxococcota bacterium]MBU1429071.1 hypothetical protein [Myxococcota bacterium]MBU1897982.1 hypothetical protein [Myxococcota bacterium]
MPNFPMALPHGPIQEVYPDLFMVRGSFDMKPGVRITRNMIIARDRGALTLINAVRLSAEGEAALEALGEVKHLVRLGAFHGADDPYYRQRYDLTFWALPAQALDAPADALLSADLLPLPQAQLFTLRHSRFPEGALLLPIDGGLLITCDLIVNIVETEGMSLLAKLVTTLMGFKRPCFVGKPFRQAMTLRGGPSLLEDYRRLLALEWRHVLTAHGPLHKETGKAALRASLERIYGEAP